MLLNETDILDAEGKGDNLNKIDTVLALQLSNVFRLGYIGHIGALASAASDTDV